MQPIFADPKTDFIFKRIFGTESHKHLLVQLLNALLELEGDHRIKELSYLPSEKKVPIQNLKLSIVDAHCQDHRGVYYVVEMQVFHAEGFEERVVYNAAKTFVTQLRVSQNYPELEDVVGVSICGFSLWPHPKDERDERIPMLSRWRMREQHTGSQRGLGQLQYVFLELPKYEGGDEPVSIVDRWAYFFREAENLEMIPPALDMEPFREAFEVARVASFTAEEWMVYDREKMAEQDERGALSRAQRIGREEGIEVGMERGRIEGMAELLMGLVEPRFGTPEEAIVTRIRTATAEQLVRWAERIPTAESLDEVFRDP
jgi:predicted transposase/invertase (TIGR01784 family)